MAAFNGAPGMGCHNWYSKWIIAKTSANCQNFKSDFFKVLFKQALGGRVMSKIIIPEQGV